MGEKTSKTALHLPERRRFLATACSLSPALALGAGFSSLQQGGSPAQFERTTGDRIAHALMRFQMGYHCSQSVLEAYADDFGLDPDLARRLAHALAGGSTVGGECGAVGSGYLVLGLKYSQPLPAAGDVEKETDVFDRVRRFVDDFKKRHGAITCRELLGVDVFTKEGREKANQESLFQIRCPLFIRDAITILDSLD